jgi:hypothetical protein
MRRDSAAVAFAALDGATPTQCVPIVGGERVHQVAVDGHVLRVILGRVVVLVCCTSVSL